MENAYRVEWCSGEESGTLYLEKKSPLAVGVLQPFLDSYLNAMGGEIDYIHGDEVLKTLAKSKSLGFYEISNTWNFFQEFIINNYIETNFYIIS